GDTVEIRALVKMEGSKMTSGQVTLSFPDLTTLGGASSLNISGAKNDEIISATSAFELISDPYGGFGTADYAIVNLLDSNWEPDEEHELVISFDLPPSGDFSYWFRINGIDQKSGETLSFPSTGEQDYSTWPVMK
ncbi:unnamed protein product, partial [Discosporangium mesarthrocarpum]